MERCDVMVFIVDNYTIVLLMMVFRRSIAVSVLTLALVGAAFAVRGEAEMKGFYDASSKYKEWFNETKRYEGLSAEEIKKASRRSRPKGHPRDAYPAYPDKQFKMTDALWKKASAAILESGGEWQDIEVIRHAAEIGAHGPAMDFLAWMYQEGRGLDKDFRKAYMWYERAKIAGVQNTRGSSSKIYDRLSEREKYFADLQLADDDKTAKKNRR